MASNSAHVVHDGTYDRWNIKLNGSHKDSDRVKSEAVKKARTILRAAGGGELVIHNLDGTIGEKDTVPPGNDPYPPKG